MTQLLLVVPGLLWPAFRTHRPAQDLPLPALARLLGSGQRRIAAAISYERQLAQLLQLERDTRPLAALRRLGEGEGRGEARHAGGTHWLCADPVHLAFAHEHLLLSDFCAAEIDAGEAAALVAALNKDFAELGHFSAATPTRWYLERRQSTAARFAALHDVVGRPVQDFLPAGVAGSESESGSEARRWRHALNEIQIALHSHPVNQARTAAGQRSINSLWFWGDGAGEAACPALPMQSSLLRVPPLLQSVEPVARGMAQVANLPVNVPDPATALAADTLVVLDTLVGPARHLDLDDWRAQLLKLENDWLGPALHALDSGHLHRFELLAPGESASLALSYGRNARWRFWRRPLALDDLHADLARKAAAAASAFTSTSSPTASPP
jgi:hypothetical protein